MNKFKTGDVVCTYATRNRPEGHRTVVSGDSGPDGRICVRSQDGNLLVVLEAAFQLAPPPPPTLRKAVVDLDVARKCGASSDQFHPLVEAVVDAYNRERRDSVG